MEQTLQQLKNSWERALTIGFLSLRREGESCSFLVRLIRSPDWAKLWIEMGLDLLRRSWWCPEWSAIVLFFLLNNFSGVFSWTVVSCSRQPSRGRQRRGNSCLSLAGCRQWVVLWTNEYEWNNKKVLSRWVKKKLWYLKMRNVQSGQ